MHEPNIRRLQSSIGVDAWADWKMYLQMVPTGPAGEERADWRFAKLCALLYNMWRGKDDEPLEAEDFLMKFGDQTDSFFAPRPEPRVQSVNEIEKHLTDWIEGSNQVKREERHGR